MCSMKQLGVTALGCWCCRWLAVDELSTLRVANKIRGRGGRGPSQAGQRLNRGNAVIAIAPGSAASSRQKCHTPRHLLLTSRAFWPIYYVQPPRELRSNE